MIIIRIENEFGICNLKADTIKEANRIANYHKMLYPHERVEIHHNIELLKNDPNALIDYTRRKE